MDAPSSSEAFNGNILDIDMIMPKNWEVRFVFWDDRGIAVGFGDVQGSHFSANGPSSELKVLVSHRVCKKGHDEEQGSRARQGKGTSHWKNNSNIVIAC